MNTLIVVAHPEPRSICAEFARRAASRMSREGEIRMLDLYADAFDPVIRSSHFPDRASPGRFEPMVEQAHQAATRRISPDVAEHQAALEWSDCVLLVFPLWWWSLPAILKGWVDRVLSTDFAYGSSDLAGRRAMLCVTAETRADRFASADGANPLHHIERGILKFCGFEVAPSFVAADIYNLTDGQREALLADFEQWVGDHLAGSTAAAGPRRAHPPNAAAQCSP
jgi:NAD(P)H dehydrogenase (quinone)